MTKLLSLLLMLFASTQILAQADTSRKAEYLSIFEKIQKEMGTFKPDTSRAPDDKITRKIIELRNLRGGFNINEAIDFKLEEEKQKKETPLAELNKLADFFKKGNGKTWLDNAVIHIYRDRFTYTELKQLVKFYKTSAGKKMAADFPVIMLQSLATAEMLKEQFSKQAIK
ncbi:MAG: DUF2059 domain-containing protein [Chitinophagaceae bacterium]